MADFHEDLKGLAVATDSIRVELRALADAIRSATPDEQQKIRAILGLPAAEVRTEAGELSISPTAGARAGAEAVSRSDASLAGGFDRVYRVPDNLDVVAEVAKVAPAVADKLTAFKKYGKWVAVIVLGEFFVKTTDLGVDALIRLVQDGATAPIASTCPAPPPPAPVGAVVVDAPNLRHVSWRDLLGAVRNHEGGLAAEPDALAAVKDFRRNGVRPRYGWLRCGLPHETERPESWGPRSPADVGWTGFEP